MSRRRKPASTSAASVTPVRASVRFYVGEDITEQDIKAEFKHGILKLFVPKKEAAAEGRKQKVCSH